MLDALDRIAEEMRGGRSPGPRSRATCPGSSTGVSPSPTSAGATGCEAEHLYEQPFRLAALRGGLELQPGTSPPVLERIPRLARPSQAGRPVARPGPRRARGCWVRRRPKQVAGYLDAPVKDVKEHWPEDVQHGDGRR